MLDLKSNVQKIVGVCTTEAKIGGAAFKSFSKFELPGTCLMLFPQAGILIAFASDANLLSRSSMTIIRNKGNSEVPKGMVYPGICNVVPGIVPQSLRRAGHMVDRSQQS